MDFTSKPLISIVVPAYNVEKYLDQCLQSIVDQTYTNLEIIVINDGSTDNTPAIADQWKDKDNRIRVIHQENAGIAEVRNKGLTLSKGEYVGFVDSDDWIDINMYEKLFRPFELDSECDIAICNFYSEGWTKDLSKRHLNRFGRISKNNALNYVIYGKIIELYVWNKLYRKSILEKFGFINKRNFEDIISVPKFFSVARNIYIIKDKLYHYRYCETSIVNTKHAKNEYDYITALIDLYNFVIQQNDFPDYQKALFFTKVCKRVMRSYYRHSDLFELEINQQYDNKIKRLLSELLNVKEYNHSSFKYYERILNLKFVYVKLFHGKIRLKTFTY
ncbi:glycosyltransferase family 2 protein [Porphyromonas pogonae]|uniref:glycosyltransferase family 2 protein n=1 Tax=Porphyromonas pogonae TaxID=867595 RepID=UPI002E75E59A|nr:glycosyltransferase [Porphyromonas pogonae]